MLYLSFINSLLQGIGGLAQGLIRVIETALGGETPRVPSVDIMTFQPRPIAQISGVHFFLIVVSAIFFVLVIYLIIKHYEHMRQDQERMSRHFIAPSADKMKETRWSKVEQLFASENQAEWRLGIIEADAMLEDLTLQLGYPGLNLGERLKAINPRNFPMLQQAWHVHLLRNKIAHEGLSFHLSHHDAWRAFKIYENIFRGYGYMR